MRNRFGVEERVYEGYAYEQFRRINRDGLITTPVAYEMQRRVECSLPEASSGERILWNTYFFSGDGVVKHQDGRYKIVFDAFAHPEFETWGRMQGEEFVLYDGMYETLPGIAFANRVGIQRDYTLEEALASREWKALARHSDVVGIEKAWAPGLLNEYARRVVFPNFTEAMGIYLEGAPQKPRLRAVYVFWLECRSQLDGRYSLDGHRRLVGIAPEALKGARQRSFELCERLSNMTYPMLTRDELIGRQNEVGTQTGNAETSVILRDNSGLDSLQKYGPRKEEILSLNPVWLGSDVEVESSGKKIEEEELRARIETIRSGGKFKELDEIAQLLLPEGEKNE